jgi:hypothetical protein
MLLLGQLSDALDTSTWNWILFLGLASPIVGCLLGCAKAGGRFDRVKIVVFYYAALGFDFAAMYFMRGESPGVAIIGLLILLCGPIVGLVLMLAPEEWL